jgi:hypothetical protein
MREWEEGDDVAVRERREREEEMALSGRWFAVQVDWIMRQFGGKEEKGQSEEKCCKFRGLRGLKEMTPFVTYLTKHPILFLAFCFFFILAILLFLTFLAFFFQTPKNAKISDSAASTATTRYYYSLHYDWNLRRDDPFAYLFAYG